jgi:hypothetical protein
MSIKWALGAIIAVLSAMFVLPGIASAHHPDVSGSVACNDGTFQISADYYVTTTPTDRTERILINGDQLTATNNVPDGGVPAGMTGTISEDEAGISSAAIEDGNANGDPPYFNWSNDRDQFEANNYDPQSDPTVPDFNNFFVLNGTYDSVDNVDGTPDDQGSVTVEAVQYHEDNNNFTTTEAVEPAAQSDPPRSATISTKDFWTECGGTYCVDGDTGHNLSFDATNNCDPVRLCLENGQSATVTEFDANSLLDNGATKGSCTPTENPPPPPPTVTVQTPPPPVEQVESTVAEVSPAVDEVVALPSAGYGQTGGTNYTWVAVFALTLLGLGTTTALMARRSK